VLYRRDNLPAAPLFPPSTLKNRGCRGKAEEPRPVGMCELKLDIQEDLWFNGNQMGGKCSIGL